MPKQAFFLLSFALCQAASFGGAPSPAAGLSFSGGLQFESRPEAAGGRLSLGFEKPFSGWIGYANLSGYHEWSPILSRVSPLEREYGLAFTAAPFSAGHVQLAAGAALYAGTRRGRLIRSDEASDFGDKEYAARTFAEPALPLELRIHGGWFEMRPFFILAERSRFGLDLGVRIPPQEASRMEAQERKGGVGLRIDLLSLAVMEDSFCEDDDCDSPRQWLALGPEYHFAPWGLSLTARIAKSLEAGADYAQSRDREERYYRFFADFLVRKEIGGMGLEAGFAKDLSWLSVAGEGGRWVTGGDQYLRWGVYNRVRRLEWGVTGFGISRVGLSLGASLFEIPVRKR